MDLSKILTICALYKIIGMELVFGLPTFGNEHVHIKVHLPPEHSTQKLQHPANYNTQKKHVNYKTFHHYHRHRKPIKKLPTEEVVPLLENFYLAELDNPQLPSHDNLPLHDQVPKYGPETFLIENRFRSTKPKDDASAFNQYEQQPKVEYSKNIVETIEVIESDANHHSSHFNEHPHENVNHYVETVKFVEEKPHNNEIVEVIETPVHTTSIKNYDNFDHEPQVTEAVEENTNIEESLNNQPKNHNYPNQYGYIQPEKQTFLEAQKVYNSYQEAPQSSVFITQDLKYVQPKRSRNYLHQESQKLSHIPTPSHTLTFQDAKLSSLIYATDYQKYLPSLERPPIFNGPQKNFQGQNSVNIISNHQEGNSSAAETYVGYDSYSAPHVQGLDSGSYRNHKP